MYAEITAKNINPLRGRCLHAPTLPEPPEKPPKTHYCYVMNSKRPNMIKKYSGSIKLDEKILSSNVKGGTRFLCSCNDLFAEGVPKEYIAEIIDWAERQNTVTWWLQTKNPRHEMFRDLIQCKPLNLVLGTTIETNRDYAKEHGCANAPTPQNRFQYGLDYVTIEPIMDFDIDIFIKWLKLMAPKFVNIGADSRPTKDRDLPEPSAAKTMELIAQLKTFTEVKIKPNLKRILEGA